MNNIGEEYVGKKVRVIFTGMHWWENLDRGDAHI